jgi:hypothetical protein
MHHYENLPLACLKMLEGNFKLNNVNMLIFKEWVRIIYLNEKLDGEYYISEMIYKLNALRF